MTMTITGEPKTNTVPYSDFAKFENQEITITGTVHNIRMMSDFAFVILRTARETIQCVYAESFSDYRMPPELKEECAVRNSDPRHRYFISPRGNSARGHHEKTSAVRFEHRFGLSARHVEKS